MAGGKQRIGVAIAAVAEEPDLAFDLAVLLHLLAGKEMRRGGEQDRVGKRVAIARRQTAVRPPARNRSSRSASAK